MSIINNYTEQEMSISNKSYTNKDFNTIYPELLDLVKKLTNKWDPTTSNESDPGVVLLKLWSILADKLNYNIDKNILEAFPLSVTLRANAQRLYDMLGYNLHYYRSAVTSVNIYYTGSDLGSIREGKVETITIPKWTMLTNDSGDMNYTLAESLVLGIANLTHPVKVIQGTVMDYEVNGVTDITLDNLDSENRLFFTESLIAENGIFIDNKGNGENTGEAGWQQVSNLESQGLGQKVFKFGVLPNTNTCFIQFPQDIANLIGNGLNIKYLITAGAAGNIKANELTALVNDLIPIEFQNSDNADLNNKSINDSLIIKNINATVNGADPEDLDSAYKNYKKTVGTFETLVTNKDYENAIYMLADTYGIPLVSNVVVADRTNDINTSTQVITLRGDSNTSELVVDTISKEISATLPAETVINGAAIGTDTTVTVEVLEPKLGAFDVCLYVLEPMVDIFNDPYYYNRSFSVHSNIANIRNNIEEKKSACHDYAETYLTETNGIDLALPYIFKNFYTLTGKVATYYKVSDKEADEIEDNIRAALYKAFNARNVEFGEPVKFDDILRVVEQADTRIKTVILNEPEYTFKYLRANDYLGTFDSAVSLPTANIDATNGVTKAQTINLLYNLLAKMIVSGHVLLYKFNRDIEFEFGQTAIVKYSNIKKITTESKIGEADVTLDGLKVTGASFINNTESLNNTSGYKVQQNENIQLYAPNFYTKTAYTAYVNYRFGSDPASVTGAEENDDGKHQLNKDQIYKSNLYYKLTAPIYLRYIDENSITHKFNLPVGTLIRFVDDNDTLAEFKMVPEECVSYDGVKYMALGASQKLEVIDINKTTFKDSGWVKCLWFTNKTTSLDNDLVEYELFAEGKKEYILQDNEYFMYTNKELNELVILGSGTMLRRLGSTTNALTCRCNIKANSVIENGLSAIGDTMWKNLNTNSAGGDPFEVVELLIITLGEGAGVRFNTLTLNTLPDSTANKITLISNEPHKVSGGLYCENFKESLDSGEQNTWVNLAVYDESLQEDTTGLYLGWSVVSRANLLTSPSVAQTLNSNTTVTVYGESGSPTIIPAGSEIHTTALLAIAGGENLELSSSNNQEINFYKSTPVSWPTYYILGGNGETASFKRDEKTGFIPVEFTDITRNADGVSYASSGTKDFYFSFASTTPSSTITLQIPFTYMGSSETKATISLLNERGSKVTGTQDINLSTSNARNTLEYSGSLGSFARIRVKFEANDLSKGPEDLAKITDTLYIGKIKIIDSSGLAIYSDQVVETVAKFDDRKSTDTTFNSWTAAEKADLLASKIKKFIIDRYLAPNSKYALFDLTYMVPKKDQIDTSINGSANKNNLFGGNAIWDKNHICNKFTIPQLDTKYSSITIASSSLKEERK